jgi:hypothetical protein
MGVAVSGVDLGDARSIRGDGRRRWQGSVRFVRVGLKTDALKSPYKRFD